MDTVDLEATYRESLVALGRGEKMYWPETALNDFEGGFETVSIGWDDEGTAETLHEMLISQKASLAEAREKLRSLLAEKFSIHEVLFQADSHPYR